MTRKLLTRKLLVLIVALLALTPAGNAAAEGNAPPATNVYTGTLTVIVGDPMPVAGEPMTPVPPIFTLHLADGRELALLPGAASENDLLRLAGQQVSVTVPAAEAEAALAADNPAAPGVPVASAALAPGVVMVSPEVSGNTKWLSIACKFADIADEPKPLSYFQNMYANTYPGLDHYWSEASYNNINLLGSTAVGWYTLPQPMSYYQFAAGGANLTELFRDCTAQADPDVYFGDYTGVNLMFNATVSSSAYGGSTVATLDGITGLWRTTWMPRWGYEDLTYLQHEMTHAYGIYWHSVAGQNEYGDSWDVVSCAKCAREDSSPIHPVYGWIGQHTQAYHRAYLGWIPGDRIITIRDGGPHTVTLQRATLPPATGPLMVYLPPDGSTGDWYVLEARDLVGYDQNLIGRSITVHKIGGNPYVQVMDPHTSNGHSRHVWGIGETWVAPQGGMTVHVDALTATGITITVTRGYEVKTVVLNPTADTFVNGNYPDRNFGSSPTLKVQGAFSDNSLICGYYVCRATFLRFDPAQLPPLIAQARLRLTITEGAITEGLPLATTYLTNYVGTNISWEENGLTWNNLERDHVVYPYLPQPTGLGANWLEWDFAGVLTELGSDSVRSLLVHRTFWDSYTFSSREGANPPQLIIEYLVPPGEPTTHTFTPTNDATVSQAKPKLISGSKPTLQVKDAAKDLNAYVKFNVTGLDGAVQSATLRLWATNGGPDGGRVYATSPFYPGTTTQWLETGLKWNNAPAITGAALDTAGAVAAGQWIELDVTAAITGNGRASFALTNDATDLVVYSSKEGAHAPELVIVTD